jgi:hypothetical protein
MIFALKRQRSEHHLQIGAPPRMHLPAASQTAGTSPVPHPAPQLLPTHAASGVIEQLADDCGLETGAGEYPEGS